MFEQDNVLSTYESFPSHDVSGLEGSTCFHFHFELI